MKRYIIPFIMLILPVVGISQNGKKFDQKKNSIIVTPLGDLLNNSKSSIYYRRILRGDSNRYLSLRVGSELFNSIDNEFSTGLKTKISSWNFKSGLEFGKNFNKTIVYFGPEISYSRSTVDGATLFPNGNAIFSTESIDSDERTSIDKTTMSIFSLIGFIGFKYKLTNSFLIGIESAVGIGWYNSDQEYYNFPPGDQHKGVITDMAVSRFIFVEYSF